MHADLRRKYHRLIDLGHIEIVDDDNNEKITKEEKALKTSFKKQFKGKCRVCGKIGHKGADCWTLESNKNKRPENYHGKENSEKKQNFMGTCHYCHKKGHREAECRTKLNDNANNVEEELLEILISDLKTDIMSRRKIQKKLLV